MNLLWQQFEIRLLINYHIVNNLADTYPNNESLFSLKISLMDALCTEVGNLPLDCISMNLRKFMTNFSPRPQCSPRRTLTVSVIDICLN